MHVALHFTEAAFTLHLLLQGFERLIDIVVADKNLNQGYLSFGRPPRTLSGQSGRQINRFLSARSPEMKRGSRGEGGLIHEPHRPVQIVAAVREGSQSRFFGLIL